MRGPGRLLRRSGRTLLVYGFAAVAGAQLCFFMAVEHLSVAVALLLEYSGALLVVGYLWLRRGQRPGLLTVSGSGSRRGGACPGARAPGQRRARPGRRPVGARGRVRTGDVLRAVRGTRGRPPATGRGLGWPGRGRHCARGRRRGGCCRCSPRAPTSPCSRRRWSGSSRCSGSHWWRRSSPTSPASPARGCSVRRSRRSSGSPRCSSPSSSPGCCWASPSAPCSSIGGALVPSGIALVRVDGFAHRQQAPVLTPHEGRPGDTTLRRGATQRICAPARPLYDWLPNQSL